MALFKTIKRAFGFSDAELEEEELEGIDARVTPLRQKLAESSQASSYNPDPADPRHGAEPAANSNRQQPSNVAQDGADVLPATMPSAIFETVVRIFNESLPDFLKASVDQNVQRQYLYEALDASMKQYIGNLAADAERACAIRWENERKSLQMQMESLRVKAQKEEEECSGSKKLQLSAERQKRALTERVHDLEKQLDTLQAENEQYVLENKSLVNKLRLNSVLSGDSGTDDETAAKVAEMATALEQANTGNDELQKKVSALEKSVADREAVCADLRKEVERLTDVAERLQEKSREGISLPEEMQQKLAEAMNLLHEKDLAVSDATNALENLRAEYENAKKGLSDAEAVNQRLKTECEALAGTVQQLEAENKSLHEKCQSLTIERDSQSENLAEALDNLKIVEEMQAQLNTLEESRRSNESFLRKQKDELMQKEEKLAALEAEKNEYSDALARKDETIRALEDMTDSLRKTIESNLYEHAQTQSAMRSEIERLKASLPASSDSAADDDETLSQSLPDDGFEFDIAPGHAGTSHKKKNRKNKLRISAIDETLEDTDWLIATPPPTRKKESEVDDDPEFGYKEPVRKSTPDNPAQMSLW